MIMFGVWGGGGSLLHEDLRVAAYVISYIIIYCILITDSVGAGVKQQKQRNTSSALITVTDRLPVSTHKALATALKLYNAPAKM